MSGFTCNWCDTEFQDHNDQKLHYKSEWHRYNLKCKILGVPRVTEAFFLARQSSLAEEQSKLNSPAMTYTCLLCHKRYKSANAHAQHLKSGTHKLWHSVFLKTPGQEGYDDDSDESDEWVEVTEKDDSVGEMTSSSAHTEVSESIGTDEDGGEYMDEDEEELDPACCFMCDEDHKTIGSCMVHLHKHHGFFVPDIEYLKDPTGFLTYLGLKVKRDFQCLYCNINCQPFKSLEAVRKHMVAKSHCKVHYGDDDEEEEAELEEFYDYSLSYVDANGKQLLSGDGTSNAIELGSGGAEFLITTKSDDTISTKAIGSREYLRYYRQRPRPSATGVPMTALLAARSMCLSTVQSKENIARMKVMKQMNRNGVDLMLSKMGMKSNVIRNLPKNVTH